MPSDKRSDSFMFRRNECGTTTQNEPETGRVTRQRLQDRFDKENPCSLKSTKQGVKMSQKRWTNLNFSSISLPPIHPRRFLRSGADKFSRTLNNVCTTFGTFSQKFRSSTRRRYRLKNESPHSPVTPQSRSRHLLGRTPTKLYSPFGIESPYQRNVRGEGSRGKENGSGACKRTLRQRSVTRSVCFNSSGAAGLCCRSVLNNGKNQYSYCSPHQKFDSDLEDAHIGIWEFNQTANKVVRHSLRH